MRLPALSKPIRYVGLFVIDFGDHVSVGYTAEEVQALLALPQFALAQAYRIHSVDRAGRIDLTGWDARRLDREEVIALECPTVEAAAVNLDALKTHAASSAPPCAVTIEHVDRVVRLRYPQHASGQFSAWLSAAVLVGETVPSAAGGSTATGAQVLSRHEIAGPADLAPRSREELLRTLREPVQR